MPAPSQLSIALSSVRRLLKEEASYHKELAAEEAKIKQLEDEVKRGEHDEEGNGKFILNQHQMALEQTKAVFGPLRLRIEEAVMKLEDQIALGEENGAAADEMQLAKETLKEGQAAAANGSS